MKTILTLDKLNRSFSGKKWLVTLIAVAISTSFAYSQVAINNDNSAPSASAMLDVKATGLGFLAPRMTFAQRPASPATGLLIYQTDSDPGYYYYDGAAWQKVGRASSDFWIANGSDIYFNAGKVSVGTTLSDDHGVNSINYIAGKGGVRGVNQFSAFLYSDGQLGVLNYPGNPIALPIDVANIGVLGVKPNSGLNGAAIFGWSVDTDADNYGGIFATEGAAAGINYGVYSMARNATTNYAGFFKGRVQVEANASGNDYTSTVFRSAVTHSISSDTYAIEGVSVPTPGYGIAVKGEGGYMGVYGQANATTYTGSAYGVYGYATGSAGTRYGVYGYGFNSAGTGIGVYGFGSGTTASWAGYFSGDVYVSSDLRIGTTVQAAGYSLSVNGKVACEEILIDDSGFWPDYVFAENYDLMSIDEFENSVNANKHLPGMPSAKDIEEKGGHHIGEIQRKTLEKVEELSLYIIELNNRMKTLEKENQELKAQVSNR
jgi:hypothetical protein